MPACRECRRRKLGCSKEQPRCKECRRLGAECLYEPKEKPGLKGGAVENLNRRIEKLEDLIASLQSQNRTSQSFDGDNRSASALLRSFERELKKFNEKCSTETEASNEDSSDLDAEIVNAHAGGQLKRKWVDSSRAFSWGTYLLGDEFGGDDDDISSSDLLQNIVTCYFSQVHPWIPMIHESSFRQKFLEPTFRADLEVILRAMIVSALRFATGNEEVNGAARVSDMTKTFRDWVILHAMSSLSLENLQALTIIAFDEIGNGDSSRAWPIIGSLTRTVEYLQLSVEIDEEKEHPLLQPCPLLSSPGNWTEVETRRRVFWNIFNLDRFCSVVTGWNTSLTSDDVYQRLPADGVLWRKQEHVLTPYFGIWDKSAGRIGNSIAYLPTHYPSPTQASDHPSPVSTRFSSQEQTQENLATSMSTIGAFAYRVEATESMSRVTTYFLQQKINFRDQKQVSSWLTRFKELDLRLVHWKMFLPQKWKDTNISRRPAEIIMDPNLTLAHLTHNASMILLHQVIAYPSSQWEWASKLPSRWSAETCQAAAVETASITENYLTSPTTSKIVNSQFVFCIFVAARVLLIHWRRYEEEIPILDFTKLLKSLDTISDRWQGERNVGSSHRLNFAAKCAKKLRSLQHRCTEDPGFRIDVMGYAKELRASETEHRYQTVPSRDSSSMRDPIESPKGSLNLHQPKKRRYKYKTSESNRENAVIGSDNSPSQNQGQTSKQQLPSCNTRNVNNFTTPNPGSLRSELPSAISSNRSVDTSTYPEAQLAQDVFAQPRASYEATTSTLGMDEINPISQMFVDQQFLEMDRVISYDDGLFTTNMGWWGQDS